jgi:hypothetical protein
MNTLLAETVVSLTDIAKRCPSGRGAGPSHCAHRSTVLRWVRKGVLVGTGRVKLEAARVGGRLVTSMEAYQRFVAACSAGAGLVPQPQTRTPAQVRRASERAERRIEELLKSK